MNGSKGYKGGPLQKLSELNLNVPSNHPGFILPHPKVSFRCKTQIQWSLKGQKKIQNCLWRREEGSKICHSLFVYHRVLVWISTETYQKLFLEKVLGGNTSVLWLPTNHICEHRETKLIIQITLTNALAFFLCDYIHGRLIRFNISCQKTPREMLFTCQEDIVYVIADDCCHCKMCKLSAPQHLRQLKSTAHP